MATASEILTWNDLTQGTASKRDIQTVFRLADDGGIIQAGSMLEVTSDPCEHTTCSLRHALLLIGCEPAEEDKQEW